MRMGAVIPQGGGAGVTNGAKGKNMRAVEKRLLERIKLLEKEVTELEEDRDRFRIHFATRFRWWVKLIGNQTTPDMAWLIEADAKELREFKFWSW